MLSYFFLSFCRSFGLSFLLSFVFLSFLSLFLLGAPGGGYVEEVMSRSWLCTLGGDALSFLGASFFPFRPVRMLS